MLISIAQENSREGAWARRPEFSAEVRSTFRRVQQLTARRRDFPREQTIQPRVFSSNTNFPKPGEVERFPLGKATPEFG